MIITAQTLPGMAAEDEFVAFFAEFAKAILGGARLFPKLSMARLVEAHGAWRNDLERVSGNERNLSFGLDHFKQAGHLAFWLRRMGPVVEVVDLTANISDPSGYPVTEEEEALRGLLFAYCNEYVSFEVGFHICLFYERARVDGGDTALEVPIDEDYYRTICHFMKYKSVSPHAMFMIYKSLFVKPSISGVLPRP